MPKLLAEYHQAAQRGVLHSGNELGRHAPLQRLAHLIGRIALVAAIGLSILFAFPKPVGAIANPTVVVFMDVAAFRNLSETGDLLIMVNYVISYSVLPDETVDEAFIFRVFDNSMTTELGANTAYPFADNGYGDGAVGFYWSAATAPAWGAAYIISIAGNPAVFAIPPSYSYTMVADDYSSATSTEDSQAALANWVINVSLDLELLWDASLLDLSDSGVVLSATGELYWRYAVPGISSLAPALFYVATINPDFTPVDWSTAQADAYAARFTGTFADTGMQNAAELFGLPVTFFGLFFVLGTSVAFIVVSAKNFQTVLPAYMPAAGQVVCAFLLGWIAQGVFGVFMLVFGLYIAWLFFGQRSS